MRLVHTEEVTALAVSARVQPYAQEEQHGLNVPLHVGARPARAMTDPIDQSAGLLSVALGLAPVHPGRAEKVARSIPDVRTQVAARPRLVRAAPALPGRSAPRLRHDDPRNDE